MSVSTGPKFSVILLTAPPPGQASEGGGAFVKIDGRETVLRTVELFLNRDEVESVCVVFEADVIDDARAKFGGHFGFSGVKLATGGPRWVDQIAAAREKISANATHVLIQDAARPAVPYSDLEALTDAAAKRDAVVMTSPLRAGLIEVDEGGHPMATHTVERFVSMLTPMTFSRPIYEEIVKEKSLPHPSRWTLIKGSPLNVRVGGNGDATLAKAMIALLPKPKIKAASPFEEAQW